MTPKLINDLREALQDNAGKPVEIQDPQTHEVYVLMTRQEFQRLVYDDSELTAEEMQAAAAATLALVDPDGLDAQDITDYERRDA